MSTRRHLVKALGGVKAGTVLDHYTELYGLHKGSWRSAEFAQLVVSRLESGRELSASEYGRRWGITQRQAFEHRRHAEEVFGPDWRDVVEYVAGLIEKRGDDQSPSLASLIQLAV